MRECDETSEAGPSPENQRPAWRRGKLETLRLTPAPNSSSPSCRDVDQCPISGAGGDCRAIQLPQQRRACDDPSNGQRVWDQLAGHIASIAVGDRASRVDRPNLAWLKNTSYRGSVLYQLAAAEQDRVDRGRGSISQVHQMVSGVLTAVSDVRLPYSPSTATVLRKAILRPRKRPLGTATVLIWAIPGYDHRTPIEPIPGGEPLKVANGLSRSGRLGEEAAAGGGG